VGSGLVVEEEGAELSVGVFVDSGDVAGGVSDVIGVEVVVVDRRSGGVDHVDCLVFML